MMQLYLKRLILLCRFTFLCLVDLICLRYLVPRYMVQDFVSLEKITESKSLLTYVSNITQNVTRIKHLYVRIWNRLLLSQDTDRS
jgi:hypothetical protein